MSAEQIPILMYHSIDDSCSSRFRRFAVSPRSFKAHVRYLSDSGYQTLTVSELIEAMDGRAVMPPKPVVLTFDDGFADFYEAALPILTEFGQTVTLYVVSGAVGGSSAWLSGIGEGTRRMVSWAQLDEIRRSGIEIGAHTATHAALDLLSLEEARQEIAVSKRDLQDRLGVDVSSFAYPFGYQNGAVRHIVQREGYSSACAVRYAMSSIADDRFALSRHIALDSWDRDAFAAVLQGRPPLIPNLYRADEIPRVERRAPISSELLSMSSRSVSIVICVYTLDRWDDIADAIASARAQTLPPLEIIVVVDHNPELRDRLTKTFTGIQFVDNQLTRGLSGARNTGISLARGEVVAFLDDDAIADRDWLLKMIPHFDRPEVIGVGSRSLPLWLGERPSWFPDEFLWVVGCSYRGLPEGASPVRNCLGGAMCFRRSLFENISGFNPSLGRGKGALLLSGEETELCLRATKLIEGAVFIFDPVLIHLPQGVCQTPQLAIFHQTMLRRRRLEGVSLKAPSIQESLAPERNHVLKVLPQGVLRGLRDTIINRDLGGVARAAAIVTGLAGAAAGYIIGNMHMLVGSGRTHVAKHDHDALVRNDDKFASAFASPASPTAMRAKLDTIHSRFGMHAELLSNAGAIAIGTLTASALGFVYWWVAARNFTPEAVGLAAAAISTMTLIGMIGELGFGTLLMGESLLNRRDAPGLIAAALSTALLLSLALGAAFVLIAPKIITGFEVEFSTFDEGALFIIGCAIMSFAMVLDQALIGWLRSIQQMCRNMLFAVLKLVMLAAVVLAGIAGPEKVSGGCSMARASSDDKRRYPGTWRRRCGPQPPTGPAICSRRAHCHKWRDRPKSD